MAIRTHTGGSLKRRVCLRTSSLGITSLGRISRQCYRFSRAIENQILRVYFRPTGHLLISISKSLSLTALCKIARFNGNNFCCIYQSDISSLNLVISPFILHYMPVVLFSFKLMKGKYSVHHIIDMLTTLLLKASP